MSITTFASGSQAATVGTEHFVATPTTTGWYQFLVDLATLVANDVVELRVYKQLFNGATERCVGVMPYYGVQPTDNLVSVGPLLMNDLTTAPTPMRFSIKQTFGTSRTFPWVVQKDDGGASGGSASVDTTAVIAIASGVWDQQRNEKNASGSFGNLVQTFGVTVATILQTPKDEIVNQVWATPVRTVTSVSSPVAVASNYDKGNYTLSTTAVTVVADGWLDRDMSTGVDSGSPTVRTPRQALRASRNKVDLAGVVYKEDDSTVSWTFTVASDSNTTRITSVDPA